MSSDPTRNKVLTESLTKLNLDVTSSPKINKDNQLLVQYNQLSQNYNVMCEKILTLELNLQKEQEMNDEYKQQLDDYRQILNVEINQTNFNQYVKKLTNETTNLTNLFSKFKQAYLNQEKSNQTNLNYNIIQQENAILKQQNSESLEFNDKINLELRTAVESLAVLQQEKLQLQNDKDSLLDYIEEIKMQEQEFNQQFKPLLQEKEKALNNNKELKQQISEQQKIVSNQNQKIEELSEQLKKINNQFQTLEVQCNILEHQKDQQQKQIYKNKEFEHEKLQNKQIIEKYQQREQKLLIQFKNLEQHNIILTQDKENLEFIVNQIKKCFFNQDLFDILEEIAQNHCIIQELEYQQKQSQQEIINIKIKLNEQKQTLNLNENQMLNEIVLNRKLEEQKQIQNEYQDKIQIIFNKQKQLKQEFESLKKEHLEKVQNYNTQEQQVQSFQSEIQHLQKEIQLKEISKKNLDQAYKILLLDYQRVTDDAKQSQYKNQSIFKGTIRNSTIFN